MKCNLAHPLYFMAPRGVLRWSSWVFGSLVLQGEPWCVPERCRNESRRWCARVLVRAVPVLSTSNPPEGCRAPTSLSRTPRQAPHRDHGVGGGQFLHPGDMVFPTSIPSPPGAEWGAQLGFPWLQSGDRESRESPGDGGPSTALLSPLGLVGTSGGHWAPSWPDEPGLCRR